MTNFGKQVQFDTIREVAFGALSDTYVNCGGVLTKLPRIIKFTNNTDETVYFTDATADKVKLPAYSFELWDVTANKAFEDLPQFFSKGTQFKCRYITGSAPSLGWASIEILTVMTGN